MIFLGDIACPYEKVDDFADSICHLNVFKDEIVVLNLEANILDQNQEKRPLTLYNSPDVLKVFSNAKKLIVTLANNHMYDYPAYILSTKQRLEDMGCGVFGLVENNGTVLPFECEEGEAKYAFFGHCWRLYTHTNCNYENEVRISDTYYDDFVKIVADYMKGHKDRKVYCFMHWNYDREKLVMPMHRKVAHALIDKGVEGVIGSHSHRPQGAEIYKGKPIVYGLGNFYLPSGIYFDGKLKYPDYSKETYALKIANNKNELIWFSTDIGEKSIEYLKTESFDGEKIIELSQFRNISDRDYVQFFKKNRSKKFLVPVFDNYEGCLYRIKEHWAIARIKVIKRLLKLSNR